MRRFRSWEVISAAIAAVPGITFAAGDELGPTPYSIVERSARPVSNESSLSGFVGGRFRLARPIGQPGGPDADVDATFLAGVNDPGNGVSWFAPANWSTNPQIPDGPNAIARFNALSNGASVTLAGGAATLNRLDMNDPLLNAITTGMLTLTGSGTVQANSTFFNPPAVIFSGINPLGTATNSLTIAGNAGLTKIGSSPIQLGSPNTYTGTTAINGGQLIVAAGDPALGAAANPVSFDNGTLDIRTADLITSRNFTIGAGGGVIFWAGASRLFTHSGNISGSGPLTLNGIFGANASTAATFTTPKSYTGATTLGGPAGGGGTFILSDDGAIANSASIVNQGTFVLQQGSAVTSVNRIGDSVPITLKGAALRVTGNGVAYTETTGDLNLDGGTSWIVARPGGGGSTLQFANVNRFNKASVAFRGEGLGSAAGANVTNVRFNNGTASLVGGIIPWAYGNANDQFITAPEDEGNTLVTYGVNGVTPITSYATDINTSTASDNVLISDAGAAVTGNRFANALVLRVTNFYASTPMTLAGPGTVNLTTGVILSGNSGFDASGTTINSTPGNIVNANIDAGAAEIIIQAPSAISTNGILSGSGGLTKTGGRTWFSNANHTYTGETNLNGFVRFNRSVPNGAPSPFGNSTSPIILYTGNIAPLNPGTGAANGTMTGILALDTNAGPATFSRALTIRGAGAALIRNFSNGALTMDGPISVESGAEVTMDMFGTGGLGSDQIIVNGVISGPGRVRTRQTASGGATVGSFVRITGANSFTGGFDPGGDLQVGNDSAMGTGSVTLGRTTTFSAFGGARNIANPVYVVAGTLGYGGTEAFTWSGDIHGVGGEFVLNVTNTALTTLSGNFVEGGFFKQGPGTVVLSGNNSFSGISNLGNGSVSGGVLFVDSNAALGSTVGNSGVNADATGAGNSMVLRGGRTIGDELMFLRGTGTGGMGALHATTGNNTWGGQVFASAQYTGGGTPGVAVLSPRMTVGADAGAALNFGRSIATLDSGASDGANTVFLAPSIGLTKLGDGVVTVGSDPFVATLGGGGTSSFRGSVLASGSLDIAGGTMRMSNFVVDSHTPTVADVASISIAGGPGAATAKLDLGKNAMVVDYTGPSPLADIRSFIVQGYALGGLTAWTGNGITSSDANASNFAVGYADNTGVSGGTSYTTFYGDPVDNTALLVVWTRYGDADLNNVVNLTDFNRLAANFGTAAGAVWSQGDFNYDGNVNLGDFNRLAANFGLFAGPGGPTPADWSALASAVPEPAGIVSLSACVLPLLRRRRRQQR